MQHFNSILKINSIYQYIRSEIAYWKRIKSDSGNLHDVKLIMTLMVKDEEDIVANCIEHHLRHGVDYIFAADDGSTDSTVAILRNYEQKGILHFVQLSNEQWSQTEVVNQLGKLAHSNFSNSVIFHCDADEFWMPVTGNLKQELTEHPYITGLYVPVINVLLKDNKGHEKFPNDAICIIVNPIKIKNDSEKSMTDFFLKKYPAKVMYTLKNGYLNVTVGNHEIISNSKKVIMAKSRNITVYHFPVRSKKLFYDKVVKAKYAITDNDKIQIETAWHWHQWVKELNSGNFDQSYRNVIISIEDSKKLIEQKIIEERTFSEVFPGFTNKSC